MVKVNLEWGAVGYFTVECLGMSVNPGRGKHHRTSWDKDELMGMDAGEHIREIVCTITSKLRNQKLVSEVLEVNLSTLSKNNKQTNKNNFYIILMIIIPPTPPTPPTPPPYPATLIY